jgi:hypothetical protein
MGKYQNITSRWKSEAYLDEIRMMGCVNCGAGPPSDPHHVSIIGFGGMGTKPHDWMTIPLCRFCHNQAQQYIIPKEVQHRFLILTLGRRFFDE